MFDKLAYDRAWRAKNRDRVSASRKAFNARNPERRKKYNSTYHRLKKYGLTDEAFNEKLSAQGLRCAACKSPDPNHKNGWQVDHNHSTGAVRGILCCKCNIAVGFVEDAARVATLRAYLETYA
jgi:hypothetical protein